MQRESYRSAWKIDLFILGAWAVWLIWITSLKLPFWLNLSGASWVVLYGASRWSWPKAAVLFLLAGWFFQSLSLMPSGLLWLSLMLLFIIVKIAQFRLMIRNAFQFSSSVLTATFGLELIQLFLLTRIYTDSGWSVWMFGAFFLSASLHAIVGFFLYNLFDRFLEKR